MSFAESFVIQGIGVESQGFEAALVASGWSFSSPKTKVSE
jgi:hypothetical protein